MSKLEIYPKKIYQETPWWKFLLRSVEKAKWHAARDMAIKYYKKKKMNPIKYKMNHFSFVGLREIEQFHVTLEAQKPVKHKLLTLLLTCCCKETGANMNEVRKTTEKKPLKTEDLVKTRHLFQYLSKVNKFRRIDVGDFIGQSESTTSTAANSWENRMNSFSDKEEYQRITKKVQKKFKKLIKKNNLKNPEDLRFKLGYKKKNKDQYIIKDFKA